MKSNNLLKIGVPVVLALGFTVILVAMRGNKKTEHQDKPVTIYNLTKEEQAEMGLDEGDTPEDTLKTMITAMREIKKDVSNVRKANEKLVQENESLKKTIDNINVDSTELAELVSNEVNKKLGEQQNTTNNTEITLGDPDAQTGEPLYPIANSNPSTQSSGSVDLGGSIQLDSPVEINTDSLNNSIRSDVASNNYKFVDPLDGAAITITSQSNKDESSYSNGYLYDQLTSSGSTAMQTQQPTEPEPIPYFTLPRNSTLTGSVTMTALIGRVPIQGALMDPFPFKVLIGKENLMANGLTLPDVQGAIVAGKASGDWTLSCVTAKVDSITFIFRDGRIMSYPTEDGKEELGYLSTPNGTPCIPGDRKTNAPTFLTSQFLLASAEAAAEGFSEAQTQTINTGDAFASAVTGDQGKYIAAKGVAGGIGATTQWIRERYGQTFDAIYVPPNQKVVVNITKEIKIDYNLKDRKIKYSNQRKNHLD